jgi:hypothetical protein
MTSQAVMKRYLTAVSKTEEYANNKTIQNLATAIANFKKLEKEEQAELNVLIEGAYNKLQAKGFSVKKTPTRTTTTRKTRTSSQGGLKAILAELKKKLGSEKFKEATTGTDIQKDIQIPALKKGKRIVRKKGKTTNQYGTFKNKIGSTYYENRANRFDANQPSHIRKYKLADGGQTNESVEIGGFKRNIMGTLSFDLKLKKMRKSQEFIVYPAQEKSDTILIQSSTRIGRIQMTNGDGIMSQSHANGAYGYHLQADKKDKFELSNEQLSKLKEELAKTAGSKVGSSVIFSDNSYADKFAKGGQTKAFPYAIELLVKKSYGNEGGIIANFKGKGDAMICARALNENSPENYEYSVKQSSKYADGGNTSKLTEAEREQAEREIREAWEGKNIDDYVMYSDKYKKGGTMKRIKRRN